MKKNKKETKKKQKMILEPTSCNECNDTGYVNTSPLYVKSCDCWKNSNSLVSLINRINPNYDW